MAASDMLRSPGDYWPAVCRRTEIGLVFLAYAGKRETSSHSVASGGTKHNRLNFKSIFAGIEKKS
jgi:hypothetical protein